MGMTLARSTAASPRPRPPGVPLQVGFNRRFAPDFAEAAPRSSSTGAVGTPQLLRSVTRDPGPAADPAGVPPWTIFTQTLIHDFDTLLWLNPGAEPVSVYATADALVAPEPQGQRPARHRGRRDHLRQRRHRGRRGQLLRDLRLRRARRGLRLRRHGHDGRRRHRPRWLHRRRGTARDDRAQRHRAPARPPTSASSRRSSTRSATGGTPGDRRPTPGARCASRSPRSSPSRPVAVRARRAVRTDDGRLHPRGLRRDGLHRPAARSTASGGSTSAASRSRSGTGRPRTSTRSPRPARRFTSMTGYVDGDLVDPDGAEACSRTAEQSVAAAAPLGTPNLNLHGTGLDGQGLPVRSGRGRHRRDVAGGGRTLRAVAALGEREGVVFCLENLNTAVDHPGTPFATAADTRGAGRRRRQPAPADEPRPLPRPDRRGEPRSSWSGRRRPGSARSRSPTSRAGASRAPARSTTRRSRARCTRSGTPAWSASRPGRRVTARSRSSRFRDGVHVGGDMPLCLHCPT